MYNNSDYKNNNNYQQYSQNQQFMQKSYHIAQQPMRGAQPPTTPPPTFTPNLPNAQPFTGQGPSEFGTQFRGFDGRFDRRFDRRFGRPGGGRNLRSCINRFTYIWLVNGNSFWFYPIYVGGQQVFGFHWRRGNWEFDSINLRRILFHQCF